MLAVPLGEELEPKLYLCQCPLNFTVCQELLCAFDYIPWISFTSHLEILPGPVHSPFSLLLGNTGVERRTTRSCESSFRDIFCPKNNSSRATEFALILQQYVLRQNTWTNDIVCNNPLILSPSDEGNFHRAKSNLPRARLFLCFQRGIIELNV